MSSPSLVEGSFQLFDTPPLWLLANGERLSSAANRARREASSSASMLLEPLDLLGGLVVREVLKGSQSPLRLGKHAATWSETAAWPPWPVVRPRQCAALKSCTTLYLIYLHFFQGGRLGNQHLVRNDPFSAYYIYKDTPFHQVYVTSKSFFLYASGLRLPLLLWLQL